MNANETLINHFYTSFKNKDYRAMQTCYAENAVFNDAVFKNLNAAQVKSMWEMLLTKSKDIKLEFSEITGDELGGKAHWNAYYSFTLTGKKVVNKVDSTFEIVAGKIVKQTDKFNFYTWAKQAFGLTGLLLGWTGFFHKKISDKAMGNLAAFMSNQPKR